MPANSKARQKSSVGFTILELLIVIAVIGLLASILLVSFEGAKERARIAQGWQFSDSLRAALQMEMVAWWPLDKIEGGITPDNWFDQSHGTVSGAEVDEGIVNNALKFNGGTDEVSISNYSSLAEATYNHFTYSLWVKYNGQSSTSKWPYLVGPTDTHRYPGVRGGGNYGANAPYLEWGVYPICDGTSYTSLSTGLETDGSWHHIVFTYDGSTVVSYFDGKYYAQKLQNGMCPGFNNFKIGSFYNGFIDEVQIYSTALPQTTIQQHYAQGLKRHQNLTKR